MSRVRVKICGITNPDDAKRAIDLGADAIGLNCFQQSPRYIAPAAAAAILRSLPPFVDVVGVFVGLKMRQMTALAFQLGLGSIQFFPNPADSDDSFPFRSIAAYRVKDADGLADVQRDLIRSRPSAVLVDAQVEGQWGGTGHVAPWDLLADFRPPAPLILAGGLKPDNVGEAIRRVRPWAVDVASGVESAPGRKDAEAMRRFIEAAHAAG